MAPKKAKVEEAVDKPPEGDDERLVTITLRATFVPGFLSGLRSPILVVSMQPDEVVKIELTPEQVTQHELIVQVYSKKVTITPVFVDSVLGGRPSISLCSLPDAKEPSSVVAGKAGGKAAPAPAAKGTGKGPLSVLDVPLDDLVHQAVIPFDFCGVLTKKDAVIDPLVGSGASLQKVLAAATIAVTCSDPLLAPSNVAKYQPVVVEVTSVSNLPSDGAIALEHDGMYESSLPGGAAGAAALHHSAVSVTGTGPGVYVEFEFLGETVRTGEVRREANATFGFRRAFFLHQQPRLSLMQRLFRPVAFEVHDQEHVKSKLRPSFGVAHVNLRPAVTEQVKRFASSTQLLPSRDVVEGMLPPADYVSYGTTLKTVIEFLVPLSKPTYVSEGASQPGEILSRTVLIMPYTGSVVVPALQAIMGTLVSLKKGGTESQLREADAAGEGSSGTKKGGTSPSPTTSSTAATPFRLHVPAGITGFEVMDDDFRMMCFEGPLSTVHKLAEVATSVIGDDPSCKVLMNAELQFPQRFYCVWPPLVAPLEDPAQKVTSPAAAAPEAAAATQGKGAPAPAPSGKKAPPGGKKKVVDAEPVVKSLVQQEMEDAPPEIDAGGVGGRIRRIRLGTTIAKLAGTQRNFIKRSLPLDAVRCINRLKQLRSVNTILQAIDLNAFPTTTELIALERIHGQTLELIDVCGVNEFVSFSDADVSGIVKKAQEDAERLKLSRVREVDLTALLPEDIGLVVSFVGVPANSTQREGCSFGPAFQKFKHKGFMFSLTHQQTLRCAFSVEPPSQMLRHAFTAQIVSGDEGVPVPFVLAFHSLAHKPSDHINATFDAKLRKDKQRAPAKEYFSQLAARTAHYNATHQLSLEGAKYRDESSDDDEDFVDAPPAVLQGLDQPELIPNYVVLNKTTSICAPQTTSTSSSQAQQPTQSDYALAQKLFDMQSQRIAAASASAAASHIAGLDAFRTQPHKTATESRLHPQAPSQQRVDDLKQPWEPPAGYKGTKTGPNPFRFNGARHVLDDEARDRSLASLMNPVERRQQEMQDQKDALESWQRQVVVDDTSFHVSGRAPKDHVESQLDKARNILEDPPKKRALKMTHVPGAPTSMFTHEQAPPVTWVDPATTKHPEERRFYYPHGYPTSVAPKPISPQERLSPLYGGAANATHSNS